MRKQSRALRSAASERSSKSPIKNLIAKEVVWRPLGLLKPFPDNPRSHPEKQLRALTRSIRRGWTNPILIDETLTILSGHARHEVASRLGLPEVPTLMLSGLTPAEKRAIVIAENRLPEQSVWNLDLLRGHFSELIELDFDVELTGFSTGEVDIVLDGAGSKSLSDPDDSAIPAEGPVVSRLGDVWELGRHRLICADARSADSYQRLLRDERAEMVVTDPPYNVRICGHVQGRGQKKHREFAMASGEMSDVQFVGFLETVVTRAIQFSRDGSIAYWFIDWRHLPVLLRAAQPQYTDWKNLLVWKKSNAGQGSFYRSQHELIAVFKAGNAPHINNFGLGAEGRYRSNVLEYPGGSNPSAKRQEELDSHPTIKPVALIADLIRDCSRRNGIVLDMFGGSGTAILAAERTGRRARLVEIDPAYVDLTISRWERMTGGKAVLSGTATTFAEAKSGRLDRATTDTVPSRSRRRA